MIFLANRANLEKRRLLTRIYNRLQAQVPDEESPVTQVCYQRSMANKVGVRATLTSEEFLQTSYPVAEAELQVSFDFPQAYSYDFYRIQWVEADRELMVGWHQDDTHTDLGKCHFQIDSQGETVQRESATFLDSHPLNVFDQRIDDLVDILTALTWDNNIIEVPHQAIR